jgi:hypothetical protein
MKIFVVVAHLLHVHKYGRRDAIQT